MARFQILLWVQRPPTVQLSSGGHGFKNKALWLPCLRKECLLPVVPHSYIAQMIFVYLSNKRQGLANIPRLRFSLMMYVACINMEIDAALRHF